MKHTHRANRQSSLHIGVVSYPRAADHLAQQPFALELEVHRPAEPEEIAQGEWPPVQKKVPVRELISLSSQTRVQYGNSAWCLSYKRGYHTWRRYSTGGIS